MLLIVPDLLVFELSTNETLEGEHCVCQVDNGLTLCWQTNQMLACFAKATTAWHFASRSTRCLSCFVKATMAWCFTGKPTRCSPCFVKVTMAWCFANRPTNTHHVLWKWQQPDTLLADQPDTGHVLWKWQQMVLSMHLLSSQWHEMSCPPWWTHMSLSCPSQCQWWGLRQYQLWDRSRQKANMLLTFEFMFHTIIDHGRPYKLKPVSIPAEKSTYKSTYGVETSLRSRGA